MSTAAADIVPTDADRDAIVRVVERAQDVQSDTDALMQLHTPGAVIVNLAGRRVIGREAFATAMKEALTSPLSRVRTSVEVLDVRLVTEDVAVVSCRKTVHDGRADVGGSDPLSPQGALTYVLVRSENSWRISLAQTTAIPSPAD